MLVDYHTHHVRCGHAVGELEEYVQAALAKGVVELGLSDHQPILHLPPDRVAPDSAMRWDQLPDYVEEALSLQAKYAGQIELRVGLEADWIEGQEEAIGRLLAAYPFDYAIGSVHFLGDWDITNSAELWRWAACEPAAVCTEYFRQVRLAAQSGLFDTLGHLDVIKRFGQVSAAQYEHLFEETVVAVREAGVAVEVNASGLRYPCAEQFPSRRLLEMLYSHGVPLTVGSDAHQPSAVGAGLDEVYALLKSVGYRQVCGFRARRRYPIAL